MMKIDISELRKVKGGSEAFQGDLPDISLDLPGQKTAFRSLFVQGEAANTGEGIYVHGEIGGTADMVCSLCLKNYLLDFRTPFAENFYREGDDFPKDAEQPPPIYHGEEIDLTATIREALQLMLPMKPVCSPQCRGLCPHCGCDLNIRQCGCKKEDIDPRLAVLGQLINNTNNSSK